MRECPERSLEPRERPEPPQCAGCLGEITEEDDYWELGDAVLHDSDTCIYSYLERTCSYHVILELFGATKKKPPCEWDHRSGAKKI